MTPNILLERARALKLHGMIENWDKVKDREWAEDLITWEEQERTKRSLERRIIQARLPRFKSLSEFDWEWPSHCDRQAIESCMTLDFFQEVNNIIFCGPNGVGKTMIVSNIAHHAVLNGRTALFVSASHMLNELASQDGAIALRRRIKHYTHPDVLVIDEVGYLSYSNRHADLLFEVVSRRYQEKPIVITTNKPFAEWSDIFPNATCAVTLVDRLIHQSEIINIEADSYRLKEAQEQSEKRKKSRSKKKGGKSLRASGTEAASARG